MSGNPGLQKIRQLKRRWMIHSGFSLLLYAVGITVIITVILNRFIPAGFLAVPIFALSFSVLAYFNRFWKISDLVVARSLNGIHPDLEESTHLLLQPPATLNLLESLQVRRLEAKLKKIETSKDPGNKLKISLVALSGALILSYALHRMPSAADFSPSPKPASGELTAAEKKLAGIRTATVSIDPPSYTGKGRREQAKLQILAEAGSGVTWIIETTRSVSDLRILLNNRSTIAFTRMNKAGTKWFLRRKIESPGFYQIILGGKLSDLYQIGVIRDESPQVRITTPAPYTVIDFGMPRRVDVKMTFSDDYALLKASVIATVASGKGESVGFREHRFPLNGFIPGHKQLDLQQILNLQELGMKPGDELYFYATAVDNRQQEARTDIYTITLPDTAELMSMEGLSSGVNLMPEYFRSQRQIIIDTERLLKARDSIGTSDFRNRSNNLGLDQKLLRLRYGKFLGEESETEIGEEDHEDGHAGESGEGVRFGDPQSMIDAVSHKHDNSEDATFFEPAQKSQLKAVLTEMWKAELQLRTFRPQAALPFEYKALRLLKDLQQKSRAYVGKTGIKTPPLKPEKRLSGELEKIGNPVKQRTVNKDPDPMLPVRKAIAVLEDVKYGKVNRSTGYQILHEANLKLNQYAIRQPALYLSAVKVMQRVLNKESGHQKQTDITLVQNAFYRMLREGQGVPSSGKTAPDNTLTEEYFRVLNQKMN